MNTTPDPEETEREALAVLLHATHCGCKAYSGIGDEDNVYEEMADAMIAAGFRCLSESDPTNRDKAIVQAGAELVSRYPYATDAAVQRHQESFAAGWDARRLSESEIRRDQAEKIRAAKAEGWERGRSDTIADHRPPLSGFDKRDNPYSATPSPETEQDTE